MISCQYAIIEIALNIYHLQGVFKVSNKNEIETDLRRAEDQLASLCRSENVTDASDRQTVTIQPTCGDKMQKLRDECSQLRIILEAMEASED